MDLAQPKLQTASSHPSLRFSDVRLEKESPNEKNHVPPLFSMGWVASKSAAKGGIVTSNVASARGGRGRQWGSSTPESYSVGGPWGGRGAAVGLHPLEAIFLAFFVPNLF